MSGFRHLVPRLVRAPFARYSHAVEIPASSRWLLCSGQLGIATDDRIPETVDGQAELCFESIAACLAEADMSFADVIKITAYVTERAGMAPYMAVRDRYVRLPPPASTLLIVSGFTPAGVQGGGRSHCRQECAAHSGVAVWVSKTVVFALNRKRQAPPKPSCGGASHYETCAHGWACSG